MKRKNYFKFFIIVFSLLLIVNTGLAFDWRRVLSIAEDGDDSFSPLKVVLIFDFSSIPCEGTNGYEFLSPLVRIAYSQMYEILDELNKYPDLKIVFSFSSRYINNVRRYSVDGIDNYLKENSNVDVRKYIPEGGSSPANLLEWNYLWLPHSLKKSFSIGSSMDAFISIYRMIASSLIGRLIALHSDERVSIAALPYSGAPMSLTINSFGVKWADIDVENSLRNLKSVFGNISTFYPPILDLSKDVLDILRDNKIIWTFSSYFSASEPIVSNGVRIIGVDVSLSESIQNIQDDEGFSNWLSQMHRLQKRQRKAFAIVIDAYWWFFKSYEFKSTFFKVLSNDKYIKLVLPEELEYRVSGKFIESSEVGDIDSWLRSNNRVYLWKRFNVLLSYFKSYEKFLKLSEKEEIISKALLILNGKFLSLIDSQSEVRDDILSCVDNISKKVMVMVREDPNKLAPLRTMVEKSFYIRVLQEEPLNVNGVEDEGYWNVAEKVKGEKAIEYVKIIGLNNYLAISIKLKEKAKDYIGRSYCLYIELEDTLYKILFKLWDGRVLVYKIINDTQVLENIIKTKISIWDVIEFYVDNIEYPVKFKVELDDLRRDVIIESVPKYKITIVGTLRR